MAESDEVGISDDGSNCKDKIVENPSSKNLNGVVQYLTSKVRLAFTQLRKLFIKALNLQQFDPECHI